MYASDPNNQIDSNSEIENSIEWDEALTRTCQTIKKAFCFNYADYMKPANDYRLNMQVRDAFARIGVKIAANQFKYFSAGQKREMLSLCQERQSFQIIFSLSSHAREAAKRGDLLNVKFS